jgi:hypothetical protein
MPQVSYPKEARVGAAMRLSVSLDLYEGPEPGED